MKLLLPIVFSIFTYLIHLNDESGYSFYSKAEFNNFLKFLNSDGVDDNPFHDKIYTENLSSSDLKNDYRLIPDTAIILANYVLAIYDLQQVAPLGRITKQIMLYSPSGEFKDIISIKPYFEDWAEDAFIYFYESYQLYENKLVISTVRRNQLSIPIKNVPVGDNIIHSINIFYVDEKFTEANGIKFRNNTEVIYPLERLEHLKSLSKEELRLVRNYFFAKYDYDFADEELESYYLKNLIYYKPTYKDVSDKLTYNEKVVINYIIKLEAEK